VAAARSHAIPRAGRLSARFRIAALALIALALAGCGAPPDDDGTTGRRTAPDRPLSLAEQDSVLLLDEERAGARRDSAFAVQFRPLLEDWEEAWTRVIPGFRLDALRWQKRDTLQVAPQDQLALKPTALDSLTQRKWKLVFTPDRWIAVDPVFERVFSAGGGYLGNADPRVSVYDFRVRRALVLAHALPEGRPFSIAGWIGERRLVVAGWQKWGGAAKPIRPAVWIYDLNSLHRTTGMGPPVSEAELEAHEAMLELLIRQRSAPARRR